MSSVSCAFWSAYTHSSAISKMNPLGSLNMSNIVLDILDILIPFTPSTKSQYEDMVAIVEKDRDATESFVYTFIGSSIFLIPTLLIGILGKPSVHFCISGRLNIQPRPALREDLSS